MAESPATSSRELSRILEALSAFGPVLAIKLYRLSFDGAATMPTLPCLDHEAKLHATVAPHASVYLQEAASGELHEVAFTPSRRRIDVDTASTLLEHSAAGHARLRVMLQERFPDYQVYEHGPSWWRGERRVTDACRGQITLREVLLDANLPRIERRLNRLQIISALMEKQSRATSWGVRTSTGPVLAVAGFLAYQFLGRLAPQLGSTGVEQLRFGLVTGLGGLFLYYGLKAVQLTGMANRVWKRAAEYGLILSARRRIQPSQPHPAPEGQARPTP